MRAEVRGAAIRAVAAAVPSQGRGIEELAAIAGKDAARRIAQSTGIGRVRVAPPGMTAADYCEAAARKVLPRAGKIAALVFVTQTPDYITPPTSCVLQHKLGLPSDVECFDASIACSGYINGLHLASMIAANAGGDALLLAGRTATRYVSPEDHSLFLVMGDAGTATLVSPCAEGRMRFNFRTYGEDYAKLIIPAGASRQPSTEETRRIVECESGNRRSREHLYMDGMAVMVFALSKVAPLIKEEIDALPAPPDVYAFHQANEFIVRQMAQSLKLGMDKVVICVGDYGNTGHASIPLALCGTAAREPGKYAGAKTALLAGFGAGLAAGTAIVDLSRAEFCGVEEL